MYKLFFSLLIGLFAGTVIGVIIVAPKLDYSVLNEEQKNTFKTDQSIKLAKKNNIKNELHGSKPHHPKNLIIANYYPSERTIPGSITKHFEATITAISGGKFFADFKEPGTLIAPKKILGAVQSGAIHAGFGSPANWGVQIPALQLFSSIPFSSSARDFLSWFYRGGGQKIFESLYREKNIYALICGVSTSQSSSWFTKPIHRLEDLTKMQIGINGLAAKVMNKLGVKTRRILYINILKSMQSGTLDAIMSSQTANDISKGINKFANYYYFPGWQDPFTFYDLIIHLPTWKNLNSFEQSQIKTACGDNIRFGLALSDSNQIQLLKSLTNEGVFLKIWPAEILNALKTAWAAVAQDESAKDNKFARTLKSQQIFSDDYRIWSELSN